MKIGNIRFIQKIVILTALLLLFSTASSFAQCNTFVSGGTIDGETWTKAGSPYCVNGDLTIKNLIIRRGVRVEFIDNYQFNVEPGGVLKVNGSSAERVVFKRNEINSVGWQGIKFDNSASNCSLAYCTIEGSINSGIRIFECAPTIDHCKVTKNSSGAMGGGMYIALTTSETHKLNITKCDISDNKSSSHGGGIRAEVTKGALSLSGCTVDSNLTNESILVGNYVGGGIYASVDLLGSISLLDNCRLKNNRVNSYCNGWNCSVWSRGGGIYKDGLGYLTLDKCTIEGNTAYATEGGIGGNEWSHGQGGGVFVREGGVTATNSVICSNEGSGNGAYGRGYGGGCFTEKGLLKLTNCTVINNVASAPGYNREDAYGGGLFKQPNSNMIVINTIVYFNKKNIKGTITDSQIYGDPTVTYSDIQGTFPGVGNIDLDPKFVGGGCEWHIGLDSPCVDAGDPVSAPPEFPNDDKDGDPRRQGAYDIGADEADIIDGRVMIDQMWSADFGGQFSGKFIPGDGLSINDMYTVRDPDNNQYGLLQIYRLIDSKKKTFRLGKQWMLRDPGHHYFAFTKGTIPANAARGKATISVNVQLKKDGKIIDQKWKTIPIYIK